MKTHTEKEIQIMRLALGLSGLPCNEATAETILLVVSEMERLGNKFSLQEASSIEYHILRKYNRNKIHVDVKKKKAKR